MSKPAPFKASDGSASSYASSELMSASSSLHMPADPVLPTDPDYRDPEEYSEFLTDTDRMVRHAQRHLTAAMLAVSAERHFMEAIETELRLFRATGETFTLTTFNKLRRRIYAVYADRVNDTRGRMQHADTAADGG